MSISQNFTSLSSGESKQNHTSFDSVEANSSQNDRELMDQITLTRSLALQMSLKVMAVIAATNEEERAAAIAGFSENQDKYLAMLGLLFGKENPLDLSKSKLDWIREISSQDEDLRRRTLACADKVRLLGKRLANGEVPTYRDANQFYDAIFPTTFESMNLITEALWQDLEIKKDDVDGARQTLVSAFNDIRRISTSVRLTAINASVEAARAGDSGRGFSVIASEVKTHAEGIQAATANAQSVIRNLTN